MEELAKLAYDAALRALDKQEETVRELRARTGILLAISSFAISLLGGQALQSVTLWSVLAVVVGDEHGHGAGGRLHDSIDDRLRLLEPHAPSAA